jgi:methionyl-tRNA synthetase
MLMAWNDGNKEKYILPQNVPANEFLNFEGKKFSKSRNWGIDVIDFLKIFPADPLRYTLAANLPESRDTDFMWSEFQARNNNELADILGNFINRTLTFVHKHFEGKVPARHELLSIDRDMIELVSDYPKKVSELFESYKIRDGVLEIINLARAGNKYFNDSEPWKAIKTDTERCATTLNVCLRTIYTLGELLSPVVPFSSEKIFKMLNADKVNWFDSGKDNLKEGHQLNKPEILFTKIEDEIITKQKENLAGDEAIAVKPVEELISYDDFMKAHLRVAEIIEAERIPKSEKLLKLKVKLENEEKQIIAGIAKHYSPEEIKGKKVVIVANLQPAKLMGLESQGMVLAIENEEGKLQVLNVDNSVKNGARVK